MSDERFKMIIDLAKWFMGTFLIAFITWRVDTNIKMREIAIRESEQIGKYVENALNEDVGHRKRIPEYFKTVSLTKDYRERWSEYYDTVMAEYIRVKFERDLLQGQIDSLNLVVREFNQAEPDRSNNAVRPDSVREAVTTMIESLEQAKEVKEKQLQVKSKRPVKVFDPPEVGLYSLHADPKIQTIIRDYLVQQGYRIRADQEYQYRQNWMSYEPSVMYYSSESKDLASQIARELSDKTKINFAIHRGSGLGVTPGEEARTFFVHYIGEKTGGFFSR
jgi:hypothetical protein